MKGMMFVKKEDEENKYLYPVEELDRMIREMDEGIELMLNDQLILEIEMRRRETAEECGFKYDEDESDYIKQKHQEIMREHMKQQAHKAHRNDVMYIQLKDDQKQKLREEMESSFIRTDPTLIYNLSDDQIYSSAEEKLILEKLSKLRVGYFNQFEFQNAINTIMTAIEYSLEHDYPWMSKEDAITAFNEGRIKFTFCQIPQLFLNFRTPVKDPNILRGVITGEVELVDKNEKTYVPKDYSDCEYIDMPYGVISKEEEDFYVAAHRRGQFTPLGPVIQSRNTIYNRFAPAEVINKKDNKYLGLCDKNGDPVAFDWTQENAHNRYDLFRKGKTYDIDMLMADVNRVNNGVNKEVIMNMKSYLMAINSTSLTHEDKPEVQDGYRQQNPEVIKTEQSILQKIQMNNLIK